ncbi:MAG: alanyl-tRNA synthetase [Bacteroidota bacterium]
MDADKTSKPNWLKRLGWGAFLFFLIKGIIWLAVFFGLSKWLGC